MAGILFARNPLRAASLRVVLISCRLVTFHLPRVNARENVPEHNATPFRTSPFVKKKEGRLAPGEY